MAEIQSFREVFDKGGLKFVQKLLSGFVIISEKLNATRFSFEKNDAGELEFYKKDGKITIIERTLNQLFEEPINYISSLPKSTLDELSPGFRYGLRYFHSKSPIDIEYDRAPLNGLVLTDIKISLSQKTIDDVSVLNKVSELLSVEKPPIIWYGKLDESQKTRILEYLRSPEEKLKNRFKTESFTRYIISMLNPSMAKTALNDDIEKPIDSIVFKFIGDNNEVFYAKAVDPQILEINRSNEEREPQDMYGIILSDIVEFIKIKGVQKYRVEGGDFDEKFMYLMCSIYNDFIKNRGYRYEGVELNEFRLNKNPKFELNSGFIPNLKTREIILQSPINKTIFKILVTAIQKPKKRVSGTMTRILIEDLKSIVEDIKSKLNEEEGLSESFLTFEEFLDKKSQIL